jgi:hypothetical protein
LADPLAAEILSRTSLKPPSAGRRRILTAQKPVLAFEPDDPGSEAPGDLGRVVRGLVVDDDDLAGLVRPDGPERVSDDPGFVLGADDN